MQAILATKSRSASVAQWLLALGYKGWPNQPMTSPVDAAQKMCLMCLPLPLCKHSNMNAHACLRYGFSIIAHCPGDLLSDGDRFWARHDRDWREQWSRTHQRALYRYSRQHYQPGQQRISTAQSYSSHQLGMHQYHPLRCGPLEYFRGLITQLPQCASEIHPRISLGFGHCL